MNTASWLRHLGQPTILLAALLTGTPISHALAADKESGPTRIAVFDFELEDGSAGASVADRDADDAVMRSVSTEVRKIIDQSGRYQLVDISRVDAEAVRARSLRNCNGCEARIAAALGAEQSLIGVVRRITRTEFVVSFQLRDAKTGEVLAFRESDLQMGADYSWKRGAVRLIKNHLLEG